MKRISLLTIALAVVFISLTIFGITILGKENSLKYWGENLDPNAFWLHPQNYNVTSASAVKHYEGELVSYTTPEQGDWDITLKILGDDNLQRETTIRMPSKIQSDRIFIKELLPPDENGESTGFFTSSYSIGDFILAMSPGKKIEFDLSVNLDGSRYISEFYIIK